MKIHPSKESQGLALFFGGLLPVIAFTLIEEKYGVVAGLIAGMGFSVIEIIWEFATQKKVSAITWIGSILILVLGGVSLISSDGIWFKLQPALLEYGMFLFLAGSWLFKKPFLRLMIEKQNPDLPELIKSRMSGMTLRLSFFMLIHGIIATYAAFYWSTEAWAFLKGIGLTGSMILYMVIEMLFARKILQKTKGS